MGKRRLRKGPLWGLGALPRFLYARAPVHYHRTEMTAQSLTAAEIRGAKARRARLLRRAMYWSGGLCVAAFVLYLLFVPFKGDMRFGVCRTLLELHVPMPGTLSLTGLDDYGTEMRIWFTHRNPFGQYRLESATCVFKADPSAPGGFSVAKARVGRVRVSETEVAAFNRSLPAVYAGRPDLTLPAPLPDALADLQSDPSKYYRKIF
ncbi:MAG TPA: hypothetical protein DDX54_01800 [Rhodospirillaceae bacterium]|jgi:hypothetical protein|nr:hypothetical protein [Alphaproteobacteria bacterium]HBH26121.1 hypothetical protein [Rhodospirillaceae bacterium]